MFSWTEPTRLWPGEDHECHNINEEQQHISQQLVTQLLLYMAHTLSLSDVELLVAILDMEQVEHSCRKAIIETKKIS